MKAIRVHRFGEPEVMQLEERPLAEPTGNQLIIETRAIGVNPVDTYIRAGIYPVCPELPYTPGLDAAGVVSHVADQVTSFKPGDRVYCFGSLSGCYAEQILCTEEQLFPLPDNADFEAGAALGVPYSTAYFAMFNRASVKPGETMLVHGASGAVGLAALQLARSYGIRAIGTAGSEQGLELIAAQGALAALDHRQPDYLEQIKELTKTQGVDLILEMVANVNLEKDLEMLARFGRVVVIGNRGRIEIDPRLAMGKNASILGMSLFNTSREDLCTIHNALYAGVRSGQLKPVIAARLPLQEAAQAHQLVMQPGAKGKILLLP